MRLTENRPSRPRKLELPLSSKRERIKRIKPTRLSHFDLTATGGAGQSPDAPRHGSADDRAGSFELEAGDFSDRFHRTRRAADRTGRGLFHSGLTGWLADFLDSRLGGPRTDPEGAGAHV